MNIDIKYLHINSKDEFIQFIDAVKDFYKEIEHEYKSLDIEYLVKNSIKYNLIILVFLDKELIRFMTVNECYTIYTGGKYGIIDELYVKPTYRSDGLDSKLIVVAKKMMRNTKWTKLEVTTPEENKWKRTVNFYSKEGFDKIGFRMKLIKKD